MKAADIAQRLGGTRTALGGWLCHCPLPDHGKRRGDRSPSLSIADGEGALLVWCFAGCDSRRVLDALRDRGWICDEPVERADPRNPEADKERMAEARKIWADASPNGHVVARYLRRRAITIPAPPSLRQGDMVYAGRVPLPTLVAAVQGPDRALTGIQQTLLTLEGGKAPVTRQKVARGVLGYGAVRLGPAGPRLGLAEGIETALSAMQIHGVSVWATLSCARLGSIAIPPQVKELVIFADSDEPGLAAAERAADRYMREGLSVTIRAPAHGFKDWNDFLKAQAGEGAQ